MEPEQVAGIVRCADCIKLSECAYEFGAHPDDKACTGFREPLRAVRSALKENDRGE